MKKNFLVMLTLMMVLALSGCNQNQNSSVTQMSEENQDTHANDEDSTSVVPPSNENSEQSTKPSSKLSASREAAAGCSWTSFDASSVHLWLLVEDCENLKNEFSVEDNKIFVSVNGQKTEPAVIEVFTKTADQTPEEALKDQFISKLSAEEQTKCVVQKDDRSPTDNVSTPGRWYYNIAPTAEYLAEAQKKNEGPLSLCGDYGVTNGGQYFEFQDGAPEQFVFVRIGQDLPLFDEKNIHFVQEGQVL